MPVGLGLPVIYLVLLVHFSLLPWAQHTLEASPNIQCRQLHAFAWRAFARRQGFQQEASATNYMVLIRCANALSYLKRAPLRPLSPTT